MVNDALGEKARAIIEVIKGSDKPLRLTAVRKSAGVNGFTEALSQAVGAGVIYEHPKKGGSRIFGRDPWRPEQDIVQRCSKKPQTLAALSKALRSVPKQQLDEAVRSLMADGELAPVHKYQGNKVKRGVGFGTPAVCRQILTGAIRDLTAFYQSIGIKADVPFIADPPQPISISVPDTHIVTEALKSIEEREAVAVVIADLCRKSGLPKDRFDRAVLDLYREGAVVLHRHDAPFVISDEQRGDLLTDGEGRYYVGISWTHSR